MRGSRSIEVAATAGLTVHENRLPADNSHEIS